MAMYSITPRDALFDAVVWDGLDKILDYPIWLQDAIDQGYIYEAPIDDFRVDAVFYSVPNGDEMVSLGDFFVVNPWGNIKRYSPLEFYKYWVIVSKDD